MAIEPSTDALVRTLTLRARRPASYTRVIPGVGARMYADAWALPGQMLSRKVRQHAAR